MATASTSSPIPPPVVYYDIFVSFRGVDTRNTFTSHLTAALERHGFFTYKDDTTLPRGEHISLELVKAIEESRVCIIVFSPNYAASRWCLDELETIMRCRRAFDQQKIVIPLFYDVDPADVRKQQGSYADAFIQHKKRFDEDKVDRWRDALIAAAAADLDGRSLQFETNGNEARFINIIVEDITNKLELTYSSVADHPVGIEPRVQKLGMSLRMGSEDVRIVAIWGVGGIGKTTIAKAMFNRIHNKFEGSSFLADVREASKQFGGFVTLQKQLISNILKDETHGIDNYHQGIEVIKRRLWCRKVLLVLDDVDNVEQLKKLAVNRGFFRPGSRIIVTTRDISSVSSLHVDAVYSPEELDGHESLKLFCLNAFEEDHPREGYQELSNEVVKYAGGLPLALEILGSYMIDITMAEWQSALKKLRRVPHRDIQGKLRISFDSLDDKDREVFLDIACFFIGYDKYFTIHVLEDSDCFPEIGIGILARKGLVRIDDFNKLKMHDKVRDMGREIVRQESSMEPGLRSRLWHNEDALHVLRNLTGTDAIEGLTLNLPPSNKERVNAEAFAKMSKLRVLQLNYLCLSGTYRYSSRKLKWLSWHGFPLKYVPADLYLENIVAVELQNSKLKQVWKGTKILEKLRFLDLSHSRFFTKTPDFSGLKSLTHLFLNDCTSLVEVHSSIACLDRLVLLDLQNCKNLTKVPPSMFMLKSLKKLDLSGCLKIQKLTEMKGSSTSILGELLFSSRRLRGSQEFVGLLRAFIQGPSFIKILRLAGCNVSHVPCEITNLMKIEILDLCGNSFSILPDSLSSLSSLTHLHLGDCALLQALPELPGSLWRVDAENCKSLQTVTIGSSSNQSLDMSFYGCHKLVENNNVANQFRRILLQSYQKRSAISDVAISIPGGELPNWFNHQVAGSSLSFVVPTLADKKILGLILGAVTRSSGECGMYVVFFKISNVTNNVGIWSGPRTYGPGCKDQMWLTHAPLSNLGFQLEGGDTVNILFVISRPVKKSGASLIIEGDGKDNNVELYSSMEESPEEVNYCLPSPFQYIDQENHHHEDGSSDDKKNLATSDREPIPWFVLDRESRKRFRRSEKTSCSK